MALQKPDFRKSDATFDRFFSKDNIAGIALLRHIGTQTLISVANSHIHWDPECADVKLIQVAMLTEELEKLCKRWSAVHNIHPNSHHSTVPALLCGDFNSEPHSGVYELLSLGTCRPNHPDLGRHAYGGYVSGGLRHGLGLRSIFGDNEPRFTNFTPRFKGVIDYIWYSQSMLACTSVMGGIDDDAYLAKAVGFPNHHFPSDHISLVASFQFRPPSTVPTAAASTTTNNTTTTTSTKRSSGMRKV